MTISKRRLVLLESVLKIIFEELNLEWLFEMWSNGGDTHYEMIVSIFMLYLLKSRLWCLFIYDF
jgi:hypothetical protein